MAIRISCTLEEDINSCPYYDKESSECRNNDPCSFSIQSGEETSKYVRKERWYEKYYDKKRNR